MAPLLERIKEIEFEMSRVRCSAGHVLSTPTKCVESVRCVDWLILSSTNNISPTVLVRVNEIHMQTQKNKATEGVRLGPSHVSVK
jgi:hypothetical protein